MSNGKIKKRFKGYLYKKDFKSLGDLMLKYNWLAWLLPREFTYLYDLPIGEG